MKKLIGLLILTLSLLAIGNAALLYKRSLYFEGTTRVNLNSIVENADQLEKSRLVELAQRLALISESDHGILQILSERFRRAILFLIISLTLSSLFLLHLVLKHLTLQTPA